MPPLFSDDDQRRLRDAVADAEAATSAEIVPYIVVQSDPYPAARWRGGVLGALLVLSVAALLRALPGSGPAALVADPYVLGAAVAAGLLGAVAAGRLSLLLRTLTPPSEMRRAVYQRARTAFLEQAVFDTRDRTGILLFVSINEHRIEVLSDQGINEQVDASTWEDVAAHIRRGIEGGRLTKGLLDGIARCGAVLDAHGLEARPDDDNEVSDHLRRNVP